MSCDLPLLQGGNSGAVPLPCEPVVQRAQAYAVKCLRNAVRADSREPVMLHAMRVAEIVGDLGWNADTIALALLHDVLEDGDGSIPRIRRLFGRKMAEGVIALSKPILGPRAIRRRYYHQVLLCSGENIQAVKLADFLDNVRSRSGTPRGRRTLRNALDFLDSVRARSGSHRMQRTLDRVECLLVETQPLRAAD